MLDPKDGELCLRRAKSGETLMEARSGTDVQIVRGYRGERQIEPSVNIWYWTVVLLHDVRWD